LACADSAAGARVLALAAALAAGACASLPGVTPEVRDFPGVPPGHDLRAEYRAAVCGRLPQDAVACEEVLLREAGEAEAAVRPAEPQDLSRRYRIGLVPGLFAECLAPVARAFGDVDSGLRERGYAVEYLQVPGRGTAAENARFLAGNLGEAGGDARPLILVTYSKGLTDALEFLVRYPEPAARVAAIISIAGVANGSPLADAYQSLYRDWLASLPLPGCKASDGSEILDLRRDVRREWWARHGGQVTVPVFSLVTTPRQDRVSFGLQTAYAKLGEMDSRNDGKLLWYDQLVPGGYLLGFLNADHWAVATPLEESLPAFAFLFRGKLPRAALVEGAIAVAAGMLDRRAPPPSR
jgi:hypothetical protein